MMAIRSWIRRTKSSRRRSKGAVSISAKIIKYLVQRWQELHDKDLSDHTSRDALRFRGDFRVPYCFFEELVALVKQKILVLLQTKMIHTIYSSSFC